VFVSHIIGVKTLHYCSHSANVAYVTTAPRELCTGT